MKALREVPNPNLSEVEIGVYVDEIEEIFDQALKLADDLESWGEKADLDLVAEPALRGLIEGIELVLDDLNRDLRNLEAVDQRRPVTRSLLTSRGCLRYFGGFVYRVADSLQRFQETNSPRDLARLREDCLDLRREAEGMRRIIRRLVY